MYAKHMVPRPPAKFACEKQLIRPASLSRQFAHRNNALSSCVDIFARRPTDSICDCLAFQFANIKGISPLVVKCERRRCDVCLRLCARIMKCIMGRGCQRETQTASPALFPAVKVANACTAAFETKQLISSQLALALLSTHQFALNAC